MDTIASTLCRVFTLCFPDYKGQGIDAKESNYGLDKKAFWWDCFVRQGSCLTEGVQAVDTGPHGNKRLPRAFTL